MIVIDGRTCDKSVSDFANLEEILKMILNSEEMKDRVITDVLVNGEAFSEIYPHQAEDMDSGSFSSVEVRSVPAGQMALSISAEMEKVATMMAGASREVARLFRDAADSEALDLFQRLLDVTSDFLNMIDMLCSDYAPQVPEGYKAKTEKLSEMLSKMTDVLGNEDWILLADMLEYDFQPLCEEWREICRTLHAELAEAAK